MYAPEVRVTGGSSAYMYGVSKRIWSSPPYPPHDGWPFESVVRVPGKYPSVAIATLGVGDSLFELAKSKFTLDSRTEHVHGTVRICHDRACLQPSIRVVAPIVRQI